MEGNSPFTMQQALLTAAAIIPMALDGLGSYFEFWESSQLMRLLTGSLAGVILPGMLLLAVNFAPSGENAIMLYADTKELLLLLGIAGGVGLSLWAGLPFYGVASVLSVAGEVLFWSGILWLLLKLAGKRRRLPFWRISIVCTMGLLFWIGGLIS